MEYFVKEDLVEALRVITSLTAKCEKVLEKLKEGASSWTLTKNRLKALYIAADLIGKEIDRLSVPEKMDEFFVSRLDIYENHMLNEVEGMATAYALIADHIPPATQTLLDLGCGTGLELEGIFKRCPDVRVTGIDLTQAMLDKLWLKFPRKQLTLICASYLDYDFGGAVYDNAVSCKTMHHILAAEKLALYANIYKALKPGGKYIECDYMVEAQEEEDRLLAESLRLRAAHNISEGELYHLDTPLTVENQIKLLLQAGFSQAEKVWRTGITTIVVAQK